MRYIGSRKWLLSRIRRYEKLLGVDATEYLGFPKKEASDEDLKDLYSELYNTIYHIDER